MREKHAENIQIAASDLRALLFWANVGVSESYAGSYANIEQIIASYTRAIKFQLKLSSFKQARTRGGGKP